MRIEIIAFTTFEMAPHSHPHARSSTPPRSTPVTAPNIHETRHQAIIAIRVADQAAADQAAADQLAAYQLAADRLAVELAQLQLELYIEDVR